VRGIVCRNLRLELVAGLSIALALTAVAQSAPGVATQTTATVATRSQGGLTQATVAVTVMGDDGLPATGVVALSDSGGQLAGAALNAHGQASVVVDLTPGGYQLSAVYPGDAKHQGSSSEPTAVQADASSTPGFQVSVSPATLALTAGQTGNATASITPVNSTSLTAPMFVTLSCSGLPDEAACNFTPESIEILPNATSAITSSMIIVTQAESVASAAHPRSNSVAWALLLPGVFSLGGLAWGTRRRPWLNRLVLLALVGLVTTLGTTACNPQYNYYHHGPPPSPATPSGNYTVTIAAQSSNGITATTNFATLALTVK